VNWIDLSLLVVVLLFGLRGYFRGFFREVFSMIGLGAGFIGAARYAAPVAGFAADHWNFPPIVLKGVSFVVCFFVIYVSFNLAGWLLHRSAKILCLQNVNRLGGIVLGVGKGAALTALLVFIVTSTTLMPPSAREKLNDAYLVSPLERLADILIRFGKAEMLIMDTRQTHATGRSRVVQLPT
jgi:membrane protein required for colicin V production